MTPKELKNGILQLAIQGKLVEQRPEEGTARTLRRQIQKEKLRLIQEGTIKNEQPLPEIAEDEIPFDIPDSWMWMRLGACTTYAQRKEKVSAADIAADMWSLDLEDIEKETGRLLSVRRASERTISGDKVRFYKGQILYSKLRPYLKKILVAPDHGVCSSEIVPFWGYGDIDPYYLAAVLTSPYADFRINSSTYGIKMPRIGTKAMIRLPVPLPPPAEQRRITAKIRELMPYIDRYDQAWNRLERFNRRFPMELQKSILQLAIQGKLVEQRPEEGSAEELYLLIQADKQRLVQEGAIKKEKPLAEIKPNEIPFEIPKSWKWIRTGDCGSWCAGATPSRTMPEYYNGTIPWLKTGDLNDGLVTEIPESISELALKQTSVRLNPVGTVLMAMYGATIGRLGILGIEAATNQACCACIPFEGVYNKYLFYLLFAYRGKFIKMGEGGAQPNISKEKIVTSIMPLPPLGEQKRIVARLEELLPLCGRLNGI